MSIPKSRMADFHHGLLPATGRSSPASSQAPRLLEGLSSSIIRGRRGRDDDARW